MLKIVNLLNKFNFVKLYAFLISGACHDMHAHYTKLAELFSSNYTNGCHILH
jgi:hypothetical protein